MDEINQKLAEVITNYDELVGSCDELAELLFMNPEFILLNVFPKAAAGRRESARIQKWWNRVTATGGRVRLHLDKHAETARRRAERRAVIEKYGLTAEEIRALTQKP